VFLKIKGSNTELELQLMEAIISDTNKEDTLKTVTMVIIK